MASSADVQGPFFKFPASTKISSGKSMIDITENKFRLCCLPKHQSKAGKTSGLHFNTSKN
jgi:hypothetical protein